MTGSYDSSKVSNESALVVYTFNDTKNTFQPLSSQVYPENNTVTAQTNHFSPFVVFDQTEWHEYLDRRAAHQVRRSESEYVTFHEKFNSLDDWTCANIPRNPNDPYLDTPTKGFCKVVNGSAKVQEETNRARSLKRTVSLPSLEEINNQNLYFKSSLRAHLDAEWSNARITMSIQSDNGSEDAQQSRTIYTSSNDWSNEDETISAAPRVNITEYAGQDVQISLKADGRWTYQWQETTSWILVDYIKISTVKSWGTDDDNDGLPDRLEERGVPLANGKRLELSTNTDRSESGIWEGFDTDGDGLSDGEEVLIDQPVYTNTSYRGKTFVGYEWRSHPKNPDSDDDGLNDSTEVDGWTIETINRSGEAYRWAESVEEDGNGELKVTSDPLTKDTDGDGLTDGAEKEQTHTDPRDPVTYTLSNEQARLIRTVESNNDGGPESLRFGAEAFGVPRSLAREDVQAEPGGLTDRTSDFDFVTDDSVTDTGTQGRRTFDRLSFTALDGELRTDTWLPNWEEYYLSEVADQFGQAGDLDPWDPDSDDDGLTDGQEMDGITRARSDTSGGKIGFTRYDVSPADVVDGQLNPTDPDTDDDGYWDGWIGVHGVERSENVILYMEHLKFGDGIEGEEIVSEQVGIHKVDSKDPGVFQGTVKYHSNIHIGELHWGTSPADNDGKSNVPDPALDVEVDFHQNAHPDKLNRTEWEQGIEQNYKLYGIDVEIIRDETVTAKLVSSEIHTLGRLQLISTTFSDRTISEYMFVAKNGADPFTEGGAGINLPGISPRDHSMAVFTEPYVDDASAIDNNHTQLLQQSPYENSLQLATAHVALHEIAHSLHIGRADDSLTRAPLNNGEIYSGRDHGVIDLTEERVQPDGDGWWTVMAYGYNIPLIHNQHDYTYYAFSIEELSTTGA
ncbi:hypothetical protein [Halorhabdus amylolytica]|uniref:hypothetical protein n=1 Tax=Halorhabdus amylolytica TaxID=2559573 RepID=UPI0010A9F2B9|nr:hypothetical protein [Halorhabdus amylolytica]